MHRPFLTGEQLYLRALESADLDGPYPAWLNDRETTKFLETGRFPTSRQALEESLQAAARKADSLWLAIIDRKTDKHIGNIKLGPIDWLHRRASLGILIGDPASRGRGFGREAIELVLGHAFLQLGLQKVTAGAYADHAASVELFKAIGFSIEGRQREHLFRDGRWHDKALMGLLREEYAKRPSARSAKRRIRETAGTSRG